jgi:serine phosphatase RsbU (regulator of sigma subunit)/ketosteroid isomerase-like protein
MSGIDIAALAIALLATLGLVGMVAVFRTRAKQATRRFQLLDDIARVADGGRSLEQTLDAISAILVPELGDFCLIDVIEGEGVRRASVRVAGADPEALEAGLLARPPLLQEQMASSASTGQLEPRLFERLTDEDLRGFAKDEEDFEFLRSVGGSSAIVVEMRARGKPTGMLTIGLRRPGARFRPGDAHFAGILAGRVALALDNAGLFSNLERSERERAEIAETLQRGLLPPPLPHIPGWSVAAMYRPAGAENEIGGDFYDAFHIPGGWMVVIGDVTGRGAQAASVTAHARYTLRTAAALTGDPVVALETLNRELLARHGASLCSVAALAIDDDPSRPVRLAVAGHPAPLLIDGDAVVAVAASAPVLGAFSNGSWVVEHAEMQPGQQLVVVTDGVTDAVGDGGRFGERRLHAELAGVTSPGSATQKLEGALHEFTAGRLDDDAAIIAVGPATREVEPAPEEDRQLVARLFEGFNRRDAEEIAAVCDDELEFFPVGTAEAVGRTAPYTGPAGLHAYLDDVDRVWEELRISPKLIERRNGSLLVRGRVYARSRELGIRDMPVAWVWDEVGGRFVRGEVFIDPERAVLRLAEGLSR